jgi:hypothetical protein
VAYWLLRIALDLIAIAARDLLYEIDDPGAHGWACNPHERFREPQPISLETKSFT